MGTRDIKKMAKRFGVADWIERRWYAVPARIIDAWRKGRNICFLFYRVSSKRPCPDSVSMHQFREHDQDGRSIVGISSRIWCGRACDGWRDGRLQLKITPATTLKPSSAWPLQALFCDWPLAHFSNLKIRTISKTQRQSG
jgi:hypothetical protein